MLALQVGEVFLETMLTSFLWLFKNSMGQRPQWRLKQELFLRVCDYQPIYVITFTWSWNLLSLCIYCVMVIITHGIFITKYSPLKPYLPIFLGLFLIFIVKEMKLQMDSPMKLSTVEVARCLIATESSQRKY